MPRPLKKNKSSPIADFIQPAIDAKYKRRTKAAEDIGIVGADKILSGRKLGASKAAH